MAHSCQHLADGICSSLANYPAPQRINTAEGLLLVWVRFSMIGTEGIELLVSATGTTLRTFKTAGENKAWVRLQAGAVQHETRFCLQRLFGR